MDPGFFHQMKELEEVLGKTVVDEKDEDVIALGVRKGIITEAQATALKWCYRYYVVILVFFCYQ